MEKRSFSKGNQIVFTKEEGWCCRSTNHRHGTHLGQTTPHTHTLIWFLPPKAPPFKLDIKCPLWLLAMFCFVLFCFNQTTTSFTIFTRSNYSVPKHQTCTSNGPQGSASSGRRGCKLSHTGQSVSCA